MVFFGVCNFVLSTARDNVLDTTVDKHDHSHRTNNEQKDINNFFKDTFVATFTEETARCAFDHL